MVILGVDPGLASTGVGVIQQVGQREWRALFHGHVTTGEATPLPARLDKIFRLVEDAVEEYRPSFLSIESIFFAVNVRSAVLMAHGRGVALLAAAQRGVEVHEYAPAEIKQSVVGRGRATKEQVGQMVTTLLKLDAPPRVDHEADALAAALCHAFRGVTPLAAQVARAADRPTRDDDGYAARRELLGKMLTGRKRRRR
ncbi:crossover junction endodeoxyribonuclease RuvC [bacterium]|nr:crossover junction endodeoxyribonuclease RuvC [bacterium]